jgi:integral membrane sensor domain MASE1
MERATLGKVRISAFDSPHSAATYLFELLIVAVIYFGLAGSAHLLPAINPISTPMWPPTGSALALVLLRDYRIWPAILIGLGSFSLLVGGSLLELVSVAVGTLLASFAGAWLTDRWSSGCETFDTPARITKFAIICFAPTAIISSSIVLAAFILAGKVSAYDSIPAWFTWWLGDAAGALVTTPVLMRWAMMPFRSSSNWGLLEILAVAVVASIIGIAAYSPLISSDLISASLNPLLQYRSRLGFLVLLPLMWAGLRGNRCAVATAAIIFFEMAAWGLSVGNDSIFENGFPTGLYYRYL